ncbi:potassium voltage-gated channel subfamily H member 8-like [Ostrinia nubilalis]|uniref:potassium voltage-gated channel subfamily H member 8-like n=1 Tax=Ostrinia nubilalis TaxID=29057 RepID=UPI0030825653
MMSNTFMAIHFSETRIHMDYDVILMYISDVLIMVNILANCFTGYLEGYTYKYVVLDLKSIFCKYSRTWLIVDLIAAVSFLPVMLHIPDVTPHLILETMKIFRLPVLYIYMYNIMQAFKVNLKMKTIVEIFMFIYTYVVWNIYLQFATEYILEGSYSPQNPRKCSWMTMAKLWNETSVVRFVYSLERAISMLRKNFNLNVMREEDCYETFYIASWLIAKLLVYHCAFIYIISVYGQESAAAKYFTMMRQVDLYINQRKLPPRIKKKILKFYTIKYQSSFFVEAPILACVSGQLREDIIMHTGRQLVRELEFLKQMPRTLLLQIGFKLKLVIFIAGDIIYKINTVGDCLYFIDKGTVAIYSESGKEVCHLEDGDFFGEIALVMKHRLRTVSVVAVTNCELFRLNREDFNSSIACYPTVYEHIKKVAIQRHERTCVLDENHKTEMRNVDRYKDHLKES